MAIQATTQLAKIKNSLREKIHSGLLTGKQKLPSERELSQLYQTTRITIKDALVALETEGLIYREERRGWYVSPPRISYNPLYRCHFHQMINAQKRSATTQVIQVRNEIANLEYSRHLALTSLCTVVVIERLRCIDERPVLFVENVLKKEFFTDIEQYDLSQSLTNLFEQQYGYQTTGSRFEVLPTSAPAHVAKALNLVEGQSILKISRVNVKQDGALMDCEIEYWRPDAVVLHIDSQQQDLSMQSLPPIADKQPPSLNQ